jgi:hypothetical protein
MGPESRGVQGRVRVAAERMFAALQAPSPQGGCLGTTRLPVFCHLATPLEHVRCHRGPVGALADAFAVIEPQLSWKVRVGAETQATGSGTPTPTRQSQIRRGSRYGAMDRRGSYGAAYAISRSSSSTRADLCRAFGRAMAPGERSMACAWHR